jgi:hypothetical protein
MKYSNDGCSLELFSPRGTTAAYEQKSTTLAIGRSNAAAQTSGMITMNPTASILDQSVAINTEASTGTMNMAV